MEQNIDSVVVETMSNVQASSHYRKNCRFSTRLKLQINFQKLIHCHPTRPKL